MSTCICQSRWPQMATLATPGTPIKRGLIVQRASTDIWMGDTAFEDSPIVMTRLVADTGWSMAGGLAMFGNINDMVRRSCTNCRACMRLVPGSKIIRMDDRPGTDLECMDCSHDVTLRNSSTSRVTMPSTSAADNPRASVCTSTMGGSNSGKTSTGILRNSVTPKSMVSAAITTTRNRSLWLDSMIERIITGVLPALLYAAPENE